MRAITIKVAKYYGAWAAFWFVAALLGNEFAGHGELGISAHLVLSITGLPLAPLSWHLHPNGTAMSTLVAGAIGLAQWCAVAELKERFTAWRRSKHHASQPDQRADGAG